jgi:hypothetical protein
LFSPPHAYQPVINQAPGQRLSPDHLFSGDNNARQALISFWVNEPEAVSAQVSIERDGLALYQWELPVTQGLNRTHWDLQLDGKAIFGPLMSPDLERPLAAPGTYEVVVTVGERSKRAELTVLPDPRLSFDADVYEDNLRFRQAIESMQQQLDSVKDELACVEERIPLAETGLSTDQQAELAQATSALWERIEFRNIQGVISDSGRLSHQLAKAFYFTHSPYEALTDNDESLLLKLQDQMAVLLTGLEGFRARDLVNNRFSACMAEKNVRKEEQKNEA